VAVPALSRLADSPQRYRAAFLEILEKIAMLTMPGVVFMIATSDWLVVFMLGPQWRDAGRIFMLLGLAAIIQPITRPVLWLFTTQGRSRELLKWGVFGSAIAVVSIVTGMPWGATGVAAAYAGADLCIATPLLFWYVGRRGPVRAGDFYRTIASPACAAVCTFAVLVFCRPWLTHFDRLATRLGIAFIITVLVSFLVLSALPAGREAMRSFKAMLAMILKRTSVPVV
jgi:PST family polysaccharide transporter